MNLTRVFIFCSGIAAANSSQVQYFDRPERRDDYDLFYEQLLRVKDIAVLPFADIAEEGEGKKKKKKKPPQIAASCTCKWCCKWTVCEHSTLVASVFSDKYSVPVKRIAETPALRKKTNSVRGLAGPRRRKAILEIQRQKAKTTRKLAYLDQPAPRPAAELFAVKPPQPLAAAKVAAAKVATKPFVIPTSKDLPPPDDEVLIDKLSPLPFLTVARARLVLRQPVLLRTG